MPRLSPAEAAVAHLVGEGLTNLVIADQLIVSVKTVEYHLSNIYRRLNVSSRGNLARLVNSTLDIGGDSVLPACQARQD